jgi:hypothetical protein
MPLFRHEPPPARIAERFRSGDDVFAASVRDGMHVVHVGAGMARSVALLDALAEHLPPVVDCSIECLRSKRRFVGEGLSLPEVRETIGRLQVPLLQSGGVELTVYTADDQLVLDPMLELWVYSKTDRWVYLLVGEGLEQVTEIEPRAWRVNREEFEGAPALVNAIEKTAERLTLTVV